MYILQGFPGSEFQVREALAEVLGTQKAEFFSDKVSSIALFSKSPEHLTCQIYRSILKVSLQRAMLVSSDRFL